MQIAHGRSEAGQTGTGTGAEPKSKPKPTRVQSNQSNLEIIHKTPANHRDRHREPETETETGGSVVELFSMAKPG